MLKMLKYLLNKLKNNIFASQLKKKQMEAKKKKVKTTKNTEDNSLIGRIKDRIEKFLAYKFAHIVDSNYKQTIVRCWNGMFLHIVYHKDKYPFFYITNQTQHDGYTNYDNPIDKWVFTENELRGFICYLEEVWKWWYKEYKKDNNHGTLYFSKTYRVRTEYLWLCGKVRVSIFTKYTNTIFYDSYLRIETNDVWKDFSLKSHELCQMIDDIKYIINFNKNGKI